MLAAIEDLLDSWPGTLIVVSHDRYFIERVTDQQYAILDHRLRHLPGGVDEYLRLRALKEKAQQGRGGAAGPSGSPGGGGAGSGSSGAAVSTGSTDGRGGSGGSGGGDGLTGSALRDAQKEVASIERRLAKLTQRIDAERTALAEHDQSDYVGLGAKTDAIAVLEQEAAELEERWFALTEAIG
jgi:hypothetical protein